MKRRMRMVLPDLVLDLNDVLALSVDKTTVYVVLEQAQHNPMCVNFADSDTAEAAYNEVYLLLLQERQKYMAENGMVADQELGREINDLVNAGVGQHND